MGADFAKPGEDHSHAVIQIVDTGTGHADIVAVGPPEKIGQLLDALMRHFGVIDAAAQA